MAPLLAALIPALGSLIPSLGDIYAKNKVSKDNVKAAQIIFDAVVPAVGAANAQDAVERIASAPSELVPVAAKAVEGCWHQFSMMELGSGTEGARKYDLAYAALPWHAFLHSPSFWALLILVPLVYIIVLSLVGVVGNVEWAEAVRSGIAGMVTGTIVGGAVGYYWGQTTSRNRTPPPAGTPPQ